MPSTRVTIALNSNRTHRSPLLLPGLASPEPEEAGSYRSLVIDAARKKLRSKKATRVFLAKSGDELLTASDWARAISNDVVLLVSAGEDFVGVKSESSKNEPGTVFSRSNKLCEDFTDPCQTCQILTVPSVS